MPEYNLQIGESCRVGDFTIKIAAIDGEMLSVCIIAPIAVWIASGGAFNGVKAPGEDP